MASIALHSLGKLALLFLVNNSVGSSVNHEIMLLVVVLLAYGHVLNGYVGSEFPAAEIAWDSPVYRVCGAH